MYCTVLYCFDVYLSVNLGGFSKNVLRFPEYVRWSASGRNTTWYDGNYRKYDWGRTGMDSWVEWELLWLWLSLWLCQAGQAAWLLLPLLCQVFFTWLSSLCISWCNYIISGMCICEVCELLFLNTNRNWGILVQDTLSSVLLSCFWCFLLYLWGLGSYLYPHPSDCPGLVGDRNSESSWNRSPLLRHGCGCI